MALAGFLVRGGIVVFLLPIVALPSPVGHLRPDRADPVGDGAGRGDRAAGRAVRVDRAPWPSRVLLLLAWFAAATEAALIRDAPAWDELDPARPVAPHRRGESGRILTARLVAHLPFAIALVVGRRSASSTRPIGS